MRLVTIQTGDSFSPAVLQGDYVVPISVAGGPASMKALIEMGPRGLALASQAARTGTGSALDKTQFVAPIQNPEWRWAIVNYVRSLQKQYPVEAGK